MKIQTAEKTNFGICIVQNKTYNQIMRYALENNKFTKFLKTIENIDKYEKDIFVKMDLCYTEDYPTVVFSRYEKGLDGLELTNQVDYISTKKDDNPIKYALKQFFKLGANRGNNNHYRDIVLAENCDMSHTFLF